MLKIKNDILIFNYTRQKNPLGNKVMKFCEVRTEKNKKKGFFYFT